MKTMEKEAPTDAELVAETLAGDREAFGCLYDRYAALVRAVVGGAARDYPMVQDLAQESFLRAYRNLSRLRDRDRFGAWIVGIARQVAREQRRSLRRDRHQFVAGNCLEMESPEDDFKAIGDAEELDRVMRLVVALPERERLAIHAFFLQQRAAWQAAELLDLSRSGFYALLERALRRLTARLRRGEAQKETK
jgi:RNA polymerase sigma-70 factor (ECF subfamily)